MIVLILLEMENGILKKFLSFLMIMVLMEFEILQMKVKEMVCMMVIGNYLIVE